MTEREQRSRARLAVASLLVFPLAGPLAAALTFAVPLAILGLFTLGPGGLFYYLFLAAWWLPGLYALLAPPLLLTGFLVAIAVRFVARPTIILAFIAAELAFVAYFALWLLIPGGIEAVAGNDANLWGEMRTTPATMLFILVVTAECWYVLGKIDARVSWSLRALNDPDRMGSAKALASYAAMAIGAAALAMVFTGASELPATAWRDCIEGDWDDRIRGCTAILKRGEEEPAERRAVAHLRRGYAYHGAYRDIARAMPDYSEAIRLVPDNAEAHARRGLAHSQRGEHDAAIADLEIATRLNPEILRPARETHNVYRSLGLAYAKMGDFDRAIAAHTSEIKAEPRYADGYLHRGTAYLAKGDTDSAAADFSEAIRLEPFRGEGYVRRGLIFLSKGDADRALADFDEAIRRRPDLKATGPAYRARGSLLESKGNLSDALAAYEKATQLDPSDAEARQGVERIRARQQGG